jgi:O-antigen/teichoic acid export membrane protein
VTASTNLPAAEAPHRDKRLVLRNTLYLVLAQVVNMPLSLVINGMMGRRLGPDEFGVMYLTGTFAYFGYLLVDWGQSFTLPAMVAQDRSRAGGLFGSGLAWRLATAPVVYGILSLICLALSYGRQTQVALAIVMLNGAISTVAVACQDIDRGFERTKMIAYRAIGLQVLTALLVIPTLMLGGRLEAVLLVQTVPAVVLLYYVWREIRPKLGVISFSFPTLKKLLLDGYGFLFMALAMALQPNVDAVFLSKLAPGDPMGWYAAARKLVGLLIFPGSAVVGSLYPTLCRLHGEDLAGFRQTASSSLRLITILVVPIAVACAFYPEVGIAIFSKQAYAPAADNLRVLSVFVLLVYFSMLLGITLMAAGRQRAWAATQSLCVVVSAILDPILVRWFQARTGNGGLGVCVTSVVSETLMLIVGICLVPAGILDRLLGRQLVLVLIAGAAMGGVAHLLSGLNPFIGGPLALLVYLACLWLTGGIDKEQVRTFGALVRRKARV